jgi:hypothetical protein
MIFKKGNMWKVAGSSKKYFTEEEAKAAAGIRETIIKDAIEKVPEIFPAEKPSPLDLLRRGKEFCVECNCDPCECDKEWKSADET